MIDTIKHNMHFNVISSDLDFSKSIILIVNTIVYKFNGVKQSKLIKFLLLFFYYLTHDLVFKSYMIYFYENYFFSLLSFILISINYKINNAKKL